MNQAEQELEQSFLKLPNLKYVGMALLQFVYELQGSKTIFKIETERIFQLNFVSFSFPKEKETIRMYLDIKTVAKIEKSDLRFLPVSKVNSAPFFEITNSRQLLCAAKYIQLAGDNYLSTRQTLDPTRN
jgi:hypothetical protein